MSSLLSKGHVELVPKSYGHFFPVCFNGRQSIYWFFKNNQVSFETQRTEKISGISQVLFVDSCSFLNLIVLERGGWENFVNSQCWPSLNICFTILTGTLDMCVFLNLFVKVCFRHASPCSPSSPETSLCRSGCPQACWDLRTSAFWAIFCLLRSAFNMVV